MKFDLISDLHEDINNWSLQEPNEGSEVLVIAGDLAEYGSLKKNIFETLRDASFMYKNTIYVAGNHEFYGDNYQRVVRELKSKCDTFGNVHFLHGNSVFIDDIVFVGGTLFTDMNDNDDATKRVVRQCMADFFYITYGEKSPNPLVDKAIASSAWDFPGDQLNNYSHTVYGDMRICTPDDYVTEHRKMLLSFEDECTKYADKKIVLVTHHAMSEKSVMPRFQTDYLMNGGYRSHLEWFFEKHKNIAVHCHGHMHDIIRYDVANTRVYCNPYGYFKYEPKPNYAPQQIEV
jgi:hypothetical protein